jgi:hypothetical protein
VRIPETATPLPALDPKITYRENEIEAECETLDKMRKVARVQGFEVFCDEGERLGGDNTAPSPLGYFVAAIGF